MFFQLRSGNVSEGDSLQCEWYYLRQTGPMDWLIKNARKINNVDTKRKRKRSVAAIEFFNPTPLTACNELFFYDWKKQMKFNGKLKNGNCGFDITVDKCEDLSYWDTFRFIRGVSGYRT